MINPFRGISDFFSINYGRRKGKIPPNVAEYLFDQLEKAHRFSPVEAKIASKILDAMMEVWKTSEEKELVFDYYNATGIDKIQVVIRKNK